MHLEGAGLAEHPDLGALGVAAHDRVVDDDQLLAADHVLERVELEPDAELAQGLAGLDERAPDVGVLDEALAERDAALLGVARRGRRAGLGDRHHQVGLDRELAGQLAAHLDPRGVHGLAGDGGVGAGEVDVLEHAALAGRLGEPVGAQPVLVDRDQLAGLDLADHAGADGRQRGVLGGDHPAAVEPAEDQRADALRVARGVQGVLVHPDERERAAQQRQHLERPLLQRGVGVVRQQGGDQAGVVGRALVGAGVQVELAVGAGQRLDHLAQVGGVDQVAVVAQRDRAVGGGAERRLRVVPGAGAGGGVARVADRQVPLERVQRGLVEDLRDQAHVLVDQDLAAVAHRDAGRLLAAVLEGVEAEVGQLGDVLTGRPDTEDPARVLGAPVLGVEVVVEPTVAAAPPAHRSAGAEVGHGSHRTGARGRARHRRGDRQSRDRLTEHPLA